MPVRGVAHSRGSLERGSGQLSGVNPACLAAHVAHTVAPHGIALGRLQFIQDLLAGFRQLGAWDEWISGGVATADPVQRAVLLCRENGAFNRLAGKCGGPKGGSPTHRLFLAWGGG